MARPQLSARLDYLTDSAHLLAIATPSTSAYLMSQCHNLMFDNNIDQTESHRRQTCGACGNLNILGWTSTIELSAPPASRSKQNAARKRKKPSPSRRVKDIAYKCELCGRVTRQHIPKPSRKTTWTYERNSQSSAHPSTPSQAHRASANAGSRKRAKIRRHGLQALLAKSKDAGSHGSGGGFGLDLLDLMKKA